MKKNKLTGKKITTKEMKAIKGGWGYWYMCYETCEVFYGGCPGQDICPGPCVQGAYCP